MLQSPLPAFPFLLFPFFFSYFPASTLGSKRRRKKTDRLVSSPSSSSFPFSFFFLLHVLCLCNSEKEQGRGKRNRKREFGSCIDLECIDFCQAQNKEFKKHGGQARRDFRIGKSRAWKGRKCVRVCTFNNNSSTTAAFSCQ